MSTKTTINKLTPELVRKSGSKFFFESTPEWQPATAAAYSLIAIISGNNFEEARDVSRGADYATLVQQSQEVGAAFRIDGLYSFPTLSIPL